MAESKGGGGPAPTGNGDPKPIHLDKETGRMSSGGPKRYAEWEREAEAG